MPAVEAIRPLKVSVPGSSELKITNRGSNNVFYGENAQVSSANKLGTLEPTQSLPLADRASVWLIAENVPVLVDFEEKETGGEIPLPVNLGEYLGNPIYASDSAALEAGFAAGASFILPKSGTFNIENVVIKKAITFIGGDAQNLVFNSPSGEPILTIEGALSEATDTCVLGGFKVKCTVNADYDKPLINLIKMRGIRVQGMNAVMTGTGTLLRFDTSYNSSLQGCSWRHGRYAVPFELCNFAGAQQMDTVNLTDMTMIGTHGPVVRTATGGLHGIAFKQVKVVVGGAEDAGKYTESALASEAKAAEEVIAVTAGQGKNFSVNDPIYLGSGDTVEINKVTAIETDTLKLARPLKYAHAAEVQVVAHGFAFSLGTCEGVTFDTIHQEGMPTGIMTSATNGIKTQGVCFSATGEFTRTCGQTQDFDIGCVVMGGAGGRNVVQFVATTASFERIDQNGPLVQHSGSPAYTNFSATPTSHIYKIFQNASGYSYYLRNVPSGNKTQTVDERLVGGVEEYRSFAGGKVRYGGAATNVIDDWGTGSPEGVVEASPGSVWRRTDGGVGTSFYVKQTGTAKTGWAAIG